ncbi:hypothetical protein [Kineosporia sp. NBRC 101677]|uniref:hypothetical protein n=1 Tax=Kineosporia sp. NBRC 101677 TaxID=3032197 RepID=UPI0025553F53|nr:hypothetical protein [Kineosporia sp. NBRC 101677]
MEQRERRRFAERLSDTELASQLPDGRAEHLVRRFPPLQAAAGLQLYAGDGRQALLSALYQAVMQRAPELVPTPQDLAEAAELGEESVIDLLLAEVDRDIRLLLDEPPERLWALLGLGLEGAPVAGVRQILDALLTIADDGHAPGTRVRMLTGPVAGRIATVVSVVWGSSGPPVAYRTKDEVAGGEFGAATGDLAVLAGQECLGR